MTVCQNQFPVTNSHSNLVSSPSVLKIFCVALKKTELEHDFVNNFSNLLHTNLWLRVSQKHETIHAWCTLRFGVKTVWLEYLVFFMCVSLEFKEEVLRKKYEEETGSQAEERARQEAEEHRALMGWNNEENLRMLKARWAEKMMTWIHSLCLSSTCGMETVSF